MADVSKVSWDMPLEEMAGAAKIAEAFGVHDPRGLELRAAVLTARVAVDGAHRQQELGTHLGKQSADAADRLVGATNSLVQATKRLALVTAVGTGALVVATIVLVMTLPSLAPHEVPGEGEPKLPLDS